MLTYWLSVYVKKSGHESIAAGGMNSRFPSRMRGLIKSRLAADGNSIYGVSAS